MLTPKQIENARPAQRPYRLYDGDRSCVFLKVTPKGGKLWKFEYTLRDRRRVKSLGTFPEISLADARAAAAEFMRSLAEKAGPAKTPEYPKDTLGEAAREWAAGFFPGLPTETRKRYADILEENILPVFGELPILFFRCARIPSVASTHLDPGMLEALGGADILRDKTWLMEQILTFAIAEGKLTLFGPGSEQDWYSCRHERIPGWSAVTDPAKLGELLRAIWSHRGSPAVCFALKVLPYVFVRSGELQNAVWEEVSLEGSYWLMPAARRMKSGTGHAVPLARQVNAMLNELKKLTGDGPYLFPNKHSKNRPIGSGALGHALKREGFGPGTASCHGFRTTASTLLRELGYPEDLIDLQLAHRPLNAARRGFDPFDRFEERSRMMQGWADYLDSLRTW
ncbi:MAG: integrase arm-type DNA-binding domain-containing protein [Deltaproteobacteria bacterium]|jgi:hypothetical protein|nr:integrase arm-type DNA-binding domain-containing protein [Deltaproteobacteria bacterium]